MEFFKKLIFTLLFILTSFISCFAQNEGDTISDQRLLNFYAFTLDPIIPLYSFKENLDKNLFGISMAYFRQRKINRFDYFGIQFSYAHIGSITESFFDFEDRTSTELMNLKFLYRYFPSFYFWRVEPFVEIGFGPQIIYTVTSTNFFLDDTSSLNFEESDFGLVYGIGLGFTTYITGKVFLLTKFNFNNGTAMTYYVPQEYDQGLPIDNFDPETSAINYINWQFGLTVSF